MDILFGAISGLFILVFLVVVHELGHAIVARRNGVVVEEFGIGFPPRAWSKKLKNGVLFSLNYLPLGGFVKLQGEHDAAENKGDYGSASFWQKTRILLAGVGVNWVVAAILLSILASTGLPKILPNQFSIPSDTISMKQPVEIAAVTSGSPAERAGLQVGDTIVRFNGKTVPTPDSLVAQTKQSQGKSVEIIYTHHGVEHTTMATLNKDDSHKQGYLGVNPSQRELIRASWSAPIVGVVTTGQFTLVTLQGLGSLVGNVVSGIVLQLSPNHATRQMASQNLSMAQNSVAGPIGILGRIFPAAAQAGLTELVFLSAIISLTLAVMNFLPIPALDGGRWFTMAVFKVFKKKLTKEREEKIQATGFMILMALVVVVTISDVGKLFNHV
jgi:regulator of sigma E protease